MGEATPMSNQSSKNPHQDHYWLATDAEVEQVASYLGISLSPGNATEITQNFSRIFLFGEDDGEQRVLKIRARWMTEGRIRFEHALAGHLRDHGLPTVVPLAIRDGPTWAKAGDLYCEIAPFVDGREAGPILADVRLMGELLGHFHRCSRDFNPSLYKPPHFQNQVEPRDLETEVQQLSQQAGEMENSTSEKIGSVCTRWKELADCYERQAVSLPHVIRHGDFHPWNLLFSRTEPGRIAALFDLDMSAPGPRVYDISYAIFFLRPLHPERNGGEWDARYRQFIEGYAETSGLPFIENEVAAVSLLIKCIALQFMVRKAVEAGIHGTETVQEYENYVGVDDWLESWGAELADILRRGGLG